MEKDVHGSIPSTHNKREYSDIYSVSLVELSSFPFLRDWDKISPEERVNIEEKCKQKMQEGIASNLVGDKARAKEYFLEAAQNGSAASMSFLGGILSDESNNTQAFYWHRLALLTGCLKGQKALLSFNKVKGIAKGNSCPKAIKLYIEKIGSINFSAFIQKAESLKSESERARLASQYLFDSTYDCLLDWRIIENQYTAIAALANKGDIYFQVRDLYALKSKMSLAKKPSLDLKKKAAEYDKLGRSLIKSEKDKERVKSRIPKEKHEEMLQIYREARRTLELYHLAVSIHQGKAHKDENNQPIPRGKHHEVAARLYRQVRTPDALYRLGTLIEDGRVEEDEDNILIPAGTHDEVAARLYREASTPAALYGIASLIHQDRINKDENNNPIPERKQDEVAARLYRKARTPHSLTNLAALIRQGRVHKDENDQPIPKNGRAEVAARMYRQAATPDAFCNLAALISAGEIHTDENNNHIPQEKQDEVAVRLYRHAGTPDALYNLAVLTENGRIYNDEDKNPICEGEPYIMAACLYKQAGIPDALYRLGVLIEEGKVHKDEDNNPIFDEERYEAAARLYRQARTPGALFGLAALIHQRKIYRDEDNNPIHKGERYRVAARLYGEARTPEALTNLASLILKGKAHVDEDNTPIHKEEHYRVAARLLKVADLPAAYYNLAILKLLESNTLESKREALGYALRAAQQGEENALDLYEMLGLELESEEAAAKMEPLRISDGSLQGEIVEETHLPEFETDKDGGVSSASLEEELPPSKELEDSIEFSQQISKEKP